MFNFRIEVQLFLFVCLFVFNSEHFSSDFKSVINQLRLSLYRHVLHCLSAQCIMSIYGFNLKEKHYLTESYFIDLTALFIILVSNEKNLTVLRKMTSFIDLSKTKVFPALVLRSAGVATCFKLFVM